MPTTPTGNFALVIGNLETLLCASTTWQTLCGAASAAAAAANVYWLGAAPARDANNRPVRPLAWIKLGDGWESDMSASGGGSQYHRISLELLIEIEDAAPAAGTELDDKAYAKERTIVFLNRIGAIVAEMEALAKTGAYLQVTSLKMTGHALSDYQERETEGLYQQARFTVQVW